MGSIFLCGHTGSINRGCEAIVRSTVKLLHEKKGNIFLATYAEDQDQQLPEQLGIHLIPYSQYSSQIQRYIWRAVSKITGNPVYGQHIIQKPLFEKISTEDLCLNIGGDTYCYGRPAGSLALNNYTHQHHIKNILWCCSIEKDAIGGEVYKDLLKYERIFAREAITYNNLLEAGIPEEKIVKCCDPAFFLDAQEVPLPEGFCPGETVGINVSALTINDKNPHAYQNVMHTIQHILNHTDLSICFIPHVYSAKQNLHDYTLLKQIQKEIASDRICMVEQDYNCQQLKYIISKCRFFIGARTHATIAAYSTGVPTLVIGYSVKSRGIAVDLFGTDEGYVLPYTQCTEKMELTGAFCTLMEQEAQIKERLQAVLPTYKQQLLDAIDRHIFPKTDHTQFHICHKQVCTGCGACAQRCPAGCIEMRADAEGFLYPQIDNEKCLHCGLCQKVCPVANGAQSQSEKIQCFSAANQNREIRKNSSSGGIFTAVAEKILDMGGVVFGAAFEPDFSVAHKMAQNRQELEGLRKSKYVQSKIGDTYPQAKRLLEQGKPVLYTGTPCQIGGLRAFLGREYDNLYTMDFICHGVPSPTVWENYLREKEKEANSKAVSVSFREKTLGWRRFSLHISFENGQVYTKPVDEDPYLRGFVANLFLRLSCGSCAFKGSRNQSDITVADHWGVKDSGAIAHVEDGVSLLLLRTAKGKQLLQWIQSAIDCCEADCQLALKNNQSAIKSVRHNAFRKKFFLRLRKAKVSSLVERYCGNGILAKIRRAFKKII